MEEEEEMELLIQNPIPSQQPELSPSVVTPYQAQPMDDNNDEWRLVFEDEFDGDLSDWNIMREQQAYNDEQTKI